MNEAPPIKIALIANPENKGLASALIQVLNAAIAINASLYVARALHTILMAVYSDQSNGIGHTSVICSESEEEAVRGSDIVLSVGGDGTILYAAALVRVLNIPVMGINTGRMGFLATIQPQDVASALHAFIAGQTQLDQRSLLEATMPNGDTVCALNEIVIAKSDTTSLIKINAYYEEEFVNRYWADGLIISTPTGSTAYNLSAGGPILYPRSDVMVITPINPHNLTMRPLVVPSGLLRLDVEQRDGQVRLGYDSFSMELGANPSGIRINSAPQRLNLVKMKAQSYFSTLREKLMWGKDFRD